LRPEGMQKQARREINYEKDAPSPKAMEDRREKTRKRDENSHKKRTP